MHVPIIQESLNYVPVKIRIRFKEINLAVGTAFFFQFKGNTNLVTTWHNITGRNPKNKETLSEVGNIPDNIVLGIPSVKNPDENPKQLQWTWRIINLYEDDDHNIPVWYQHPEHNERIDIATMPLSELEATALKPANDQSLDLA